MNEIKSKYMANDGLNGEKYLSGKWVILWLVISGNGSPVVEAV